MRAIVIQINHAYAPTDPTLCAHKSPKPAAVEFGPYLPGPGRAAPGKKLWRHGKVPSEADGDDNDLRCRFRYPDLS